MMSIPDDPLTEMVDESMDAVPVMQMISDTGWCGFDTANSRLHGRQRAKGEC